MGDKDSKLHLCAISACLVLCCLFPARAADYKAIDDRPPALQPNAKYGLTIADCESPNPSAVVSDNKGFALERNDFRNEGLDLSSFDPARWHASSPKKLSRIIAPAKKYFITTGLGFKKAELIGIFHDSHRAKYVVDYETKGALWTSYLLGERYTMGVEDARHKRGHLWCWLNVRF